MSNLPWFKLYTEARVDRKLAGLTRAEKGVWIDLLCYAAEQEERGCFDASDRYTLAMEVADGDEDLLNSTIEKLLKVRHLVPCPAQGLYETSETTRNEDVTTGNDHVTTGNSLQRYIFRTFASRQAQKVSNFPSDAKEHVNARVRKHRALKKQAKLEQQEAKPVTSETSGNDTDRDIDREYRDNNISVFAPNVSTLPTVSPLPRQGEPLSRTRRKDTHDPRQANPLWDVLVETFYTPTTKSERSNFGKVVRELKELHASPDDVRLRVKNHGLTCDWDLTINSLMTHWSELGRAPNPSRPRVAQNGHAVGDIPRTIAFED